MAPRVQAGEIGGNFVLRSSPRIAPLRAKWNSPPRRRAEIQRPARTRWNRGMLDNADPERADIHP